MKIKKNIVGLIWWIYIILLLGIVVFKFRGSLMELGEKIVSTPFGTNYNLIPFRSIRVQILHISEGWARFNILGNIVPFLPFGFLLPVVYQRVCSFKQVFVVGIIWILFLEIVQFFTRLGSFDIDDIFLNLIGIFCGYAIFLFVKKVKKK